MSATSTVRQTTILKGDRQNPGHPPDVQARNGKGARVRFRWGDYAVPVSKQAGGIDSVDRPGEQHASSRIGRTASFFANVVFPRPFTCGTISSLIL
jgi:hypothetical protein